MKRNKSITLHTMLNHRSFEPLDKQENTLLKNNLKSFAFEN